MATTNRTGFIGGKGTSSAGLDIIGAASTGWAIKEIWDLSFIPFADCTITINGVDTLAVAANVCRYYSKNHKIESITIAEADIAYDLDCFIYGDKTESE